MGFFICYNNALLNLAAKVNLTHCFHTSPNIVSDSRIFAEFFGEKKTGYVTI